MSFDAAEVDRLLVQTGRRCCICKTLHRVQVHHITPQGQGGSDNIDNAIPLCPSCHDEVHIGYAPGRVTRQYTPAELKLHRQQTIEAVQKGIPSSTATVWGVSAKKDEAAHHLAESTTRLYNEILSFIAYNFSPIPNEEWRQLRWSINDFSDAISTCAYLFNEEVIGAARDIEHLCAETISGIGEGNSDRNSYNNHISVAGTQTRNAAWNNFNEKRLLLQQELAVALRAEGVV